MTSVLGIDAAWTPTNPSGVALVERAAGRWRCVAVAPSYRAFVDRAAGQPVAWDVPAVPGSPEPKALLNAARGLLGGAEIDVVAVDMPISTTPITGRRPADRAVSRRFGGAGCSTHSPNATRPGAVGRNLTVGFEELGYPLAGAGAEVPQRALIEVYPHPALLTLTGSARRLPYKLGKPGRTWANVRPMWELILAALSTRIDGVALPLPDALPMSQLKRWEDAIDALVCAWVGIEFLEGRAVAFGDADAAIWCPS